MTRDSGVPRKGAGQLDAPGTSPVVGDDAPPRNKFSPGPWAVEYGRHTRRPLGIFAPLEMHIPGAVGNIVRRHGIGSPGGDTAKANALLIAAAPDLYEALLDLEAICSIAAPDHNLALDRARAALAKARGDQP